MPCKDEISAALKIHTMKANKVLCEKRVGSVPPGKYLPVCRLAYSIEGCMAPVFSWEWW